MSVPQIAAAEAEAAGPIKLIASNEAFFKNISLRSDVDPNGLLDVVAHGNANQIELGGQLLSAKDY